VKTLVVGVGSTIRGDDGVGVEVVRRLRDRVTDDQVDYIELGTAGLALLDRVEGYERLILVDAIVTGGKPGTVVELTGEEVASSAHLGAGHEAGLPTVLELGQKLSKVMPREVIVIAVEAADLDSFSETLTPEVEAVMPDVLERVEELLRST
jgi:hydrogenase maturation protease